MVDDPGISGAPNTPAGWVDVTVPVDPALVVWPGDPPMEIERVMDMGRDDVCNLSAIKMSAHTGTHMDAPLHFVADGVSIDRLPLDATVGRARVIEIGNEKTIGPDELRAANLQRGERVLFKTRNSSAPWHNKPFDERFVHVNAAGADVLVAAGVRTVGVDYLSVGGYKRDGVKTHRILLGAGLWVIEGLDLSAVEPGDYELICLPLKLVGADGAPARAILKQLTA